MKKSWNIKIGDYQYDVQYTAGSFSGMRKIIVDGVESVIPNKMSYDFIGMDVPVEIGGKRCRLVVHGKKADIAVDGVFVESGEVYEPLQGMPKWNWIFIVMCLAIPIISMGGALPVLIGLMGAMWTCRVASANKRSVVVKMLCCWGIAMLCWILALLAMFAMTLLLA